MPFDPQLHYFYLYLKRHVEENHNIRCERADEQILTIPFPDKIDDYISDARLVIVECTSKNPNVFYELGVARAKDRKIILLTRNAVEEVPADIRHYDIIHYDLASEVDLFNKLDKALNTILADRYVSLYSKACALFELFKKQTNLPVDQVGKDVFREQVKSAERKEGLPSEEDTVELERFLLPRIVADSYDLGINERINKWIGDRAAE
jgi:hypothetical protein